MIKTSWKTLVDWKNLSSSSLVFDEQILTIKSIKKEEIISTNGKKEIVAVCRFSDSELPMVLNKTNLRTLENIFRTDKIEDWYGKKIMVYVKSGIKFGKELVKGLRVREVPQRFCQVCKKEISEEIYQGSIKKYGIAFCSAECKEKVDKGEIKIVAKEKAEAPTLENLIENMEEEASETKNVEN